MCNSSTKTERVVVSGMYLTINDTPDNKVRRIASALDKSETTVRRILRDCRENGLLGQDTR